MTAQTTQPERTMGQGCADRIYDAAFEMATAVAAYNASRGADPDPVACAPDDMQVALALANAVKTARELYREVASYASDAPS